jgi:hypothetical protein
VNIDVTKNRLGNHIASTVKPFLGNVVMDFGFVLEGQNSEELPENILGAARVIRAKLDDTPYLPILNNPSSPLSSIHHHMGTSAGVLTPSNMHAKSSNNNKIQFSNRPSSSTPKPLSRSTSGSGDNGGGGGGGGDSGEEGVKSYLLQEDEEVVTKLDLSNMNLCLHVQDVADLLLQLRSPEVIDLTQNHRVGGKQNMYKVHYQVRTVYIYIIVSLLLLYCFILQYFSQFEIHFYRFFYLFFLISF